MHMDMLIDHSNNKISLGAWPNVGVFLCHCMLSVTMNNLELANAANGTFKEMYGGVFVDCVPKSYCSKIEHQSI